MNLLRFFFAPRQSAPVARERLQILLTHERSAGNQSDLVSILREDVLAVIAKHVTVDPDKVEVKLDRLKAVSILEIDIEIPHPPARSAAPSKRSRKAAAARRGFSASSA